MYAKYDRLSQEAQEDGTGEVHVSTIRDQPSSKARRTIYALVVLLFISISCNVVLLAQVHLGANIGEAISPYVGLRMNNPKPLPHDNRTLDDPMWDAPEFDTYTGMVALSDEFTESKGLLRAQRYPWDHSKGIYVLHGYHSLHCVYVIRQTIMEYRDQMPLTWRMTHVTHCLHVLREDTTCYADDMPRYTGTLHEEAGHRVGSSGTGETRMCRDWSKLREFAIQNSACYRRPLDHHIPLLDRYKFCPDGSKPWENMEQISDSS